MIQTYIYHKSNLVKYLYAQGKLLTYLLLSRVLFYDSIVHGSQQSTLGYTQR